LADNDIAIEHDDIILTDDNYNTSNIGYFIKFTICIIICLVIMVGMGYILLQGISGEMIETQFIYNQTPNGITTTYNGITYDTYTEYHPITHDAAVNDYHVYQLQNNDTSVYIIRKMGFNSYKFETYNPTELDKTTNIKDNSTHNPPWLTEGMYK
jgi:hypothetical protein